MLATASNSLAFNPQALDSLRFQAKMDGGKSALRQAAQQYESYFLQMMMKSMRQTVSQDGPFSSQETKTYTEMFDQELTQNIAKGKGIGLADMLVNQMQASLESKPEVKLQPRPYNLPSLLPAAATAQADARGLTPKTFVNTLWPHAVDAANELGVSPHALLAQAALETAWGTREARGANGKSYNLFNIKAGKNWKGATVSADTTEYVAGTAVQQNATFRAYGSYAESFADYTSLLKSNPRYAQALSHGGDVQGFVRGLQQGGYATDPVYADKIMRVASSPAFRESLSTEPAY